MTLRSLLARLRADERHRRTDRFEREALRSIGAAPLAPAVTFEAARPQAP